MSVWIGMVFYIILLRIIFKDFNNKKLQKIFLILSSISIIFVMGSRYANISLSGDLNNYYRLFYNASRMSFSTLFEVYNMEWGYIVFNKLLAICIPWTQIIIYVEAVICVYVISRFIYNNCDDPFMGIILYISHGLMIFQLTGFRQAIAMSICLFSVEFIKGRNPLKFFIAIAFASTFHSTAIVFSIMYIIGNNKINLKNIVKYCILFILFIVIAPELLKFGSNITGSDYTKDGFKGNLLGPLINIIIYIIAILLFYKGNKRSKDLWKFNMTFICLIIYTLRFISIPFERIAFYFAPGAIVALIDGIINIKHKKRREIIYIGILFGSILLFLYRVYSTIGTNYRFFFS